MNNNNNGDVRYGVKARINEFGMTIRKQRAEKLIWKKNQNKVNKWIMRNINRIVSYLNNNNRRM